MNCMTQSGEPTQMMRVNVVWGTPDAEKLVSRMARISNQENETNYDTAPKLLRYLIKHKHWSPFEMINACLEIETTRDVSRQILRHRSFSFQEFSQRYANVTQEAVYREPRLVDKVNRQNSLPTTDDDLRTWWHLEQLRVSSIATDAYTNALVKGIAKEVARSVLPEGQTYTRMYMNGSARSWIHFVEVRCGVDTQLETRLLALEIKDKLRVIWPTIMECIE